jgi:MFS transporter, BCD family, chlorophyll transporter
VGIKNAVTFGNTVASIGFMLLISSGVMNSKGLLYIALVVIGIGLGCCTIGNIVLMISMNAGRAGLYIGLWGTAQGLAQFTSGVGMGAIRDTFMQLSPNPMIAYGAVFMLEIIAFTISTGMLPRFSQEKFEEESKISIERVLAVAADG